jgi:hypothetical protein
MGTPALQHKPPQLHISTYILVYSSFCTEILVVVIVKISLRFHVTVDAYSSSLKMDRQHVPPQDCTHFPSHMVSHFSRMGLLLQQWFCLCWITSIFEVSKGCILSIKGLNILQHNCKPYNVKKKPNIRKIWRFMLHYNCSKLYQNISYMFIVNTWLNWGNHVFFKSILHPNCILQPNSYRA